MRVLIIGAHHGVGALTVDRLRAAGHDVSAFDGDVLDAEGVSRAVVGMQAVVSTLGPRAGSPADLCARGTKQLVEAMKASGVRRLVQVTGAMIGHPRERLGWLYRFIESRVPAEALADRRMQEQLVMSSGLDWTLLRPTRLTNAAPRGRWRTGEDETVGALAAIPRADVAEQIARALDGPETVHKKLTLQS